MERMRFHLVNDHVRSNALNAVKTAPETFLVDIRKPSRNLLQNAKFHALLGDIARQAEWCGKKLKPEQWKVLLISGHAVATKQQAEIVPGIEGEFVNIRESSAEMSVSRMASLIEYVTAWAVGQGIKFTEGRYS
ncbi:recombination protein NinB [Enterobacteriaceae bacterium RIT711]|nr:recombination protein NinB [Enterobacteriaceae bacterium RIT711]